MRNYNAESLQCLSNEELHRRAMSGNSAALNRLYLNVKNMFRNCPKVYSNFLVYEDWICIAAEEFSLKWHEFDSVRYPHVKFSTWIFGVVKHRWINEINKMKCQKRQVDLTALVEEHEELFYTEFCMYDDLLYIEGFKNRFVKYFEAHAPSAAVEILDIFLLFGAMTIEDVTAITQQSAEYVQEMICIIKKYIYQFCGLERNLSYANSI